MILGLLVSLGLPVSLRSLVSLRLAGFLAFIGVPGPLDILPG
jgi:hypothetical protein